MPTGSNRLSLAAGFDFLHSFCILNREGSAVRVLGPLCVCVRVSERYVVSWKPIKLQC